MNKEVVEAKEIRKIQTDADRDKKLILRLYRQLINEVNKKLKQENPVGVKLIKKAFNLASTAHANIKRRDGDPYIIHPIKVALICIKEIGLGIRSVIASLLHDTVEDTNITINDIQKIFGKEISKIVSGLTKVSKFNSHSTSKQIENFKFILMSISKDPRVILIKLADRLHNMRTLEHMPRHKQLKIASETSYIYAPLAHRLGLFSIKTELEDTALKFLEPEVYRSIARKLDAKKKERDKYISDFIRPIKKALSQENIEFTITGRPKSISSIRNKITTKQVSFEEVYDLLAVRIIIKSKPNEERHLCWKTYSIISSYYSSLPDRLRDWISRPKSNGYEALHTTVLGHDGRWVEIQIRTERMHHIAERGLAAHYKYKETKSRATQSKFDEWTTEIRNVIEKENKSKQSSYDFLQDFKADFLSEEVHVFTPGGDIKTLPRGSTVLDFAFAVHSNVGSSMIGARVNKRLVPVDYVLRNRDQVQIKTSPLQSPENSWLSIAFSSKTKSKIKDAIRKDRATIKERGKVIVQEYFAKRNVIGIDDNYEFCVRYFNQDNDIELYKKLIKKSIDIKNLDQCKVTEGKLVEVKPLSQKIGKLVSVDILPKLPLSNKKKMNLPSSNIPITIENSHNSYAFSIASCCNPIQGDAIVGFLTSNEGVKIHRWDCKNAKYLMAVLANKVVKVKWDKDIKYQTSSLIIFEGLDRVGIVNAVSNKISIKYRTNMSELHFKTQKGHCKGEIKVDISNKNEVERIIDDLLQIDGVKRVYRKN